MKPWQKIVGLVLTTVLVLAFYIGNMAYKVVTKIAEGFQAPTPTTNGDPFNPGAETAAERDTFDIFEYMNQVINADIPATTVEPYNPATALAEFDEAAPVPWDFDNKMENPKDILWGYVDSRCSKELWNSARQRALFNTANNVEIGPNGQLAYYSTTLNGMLFHDPQQINAVKFAEFIIDFATEEVIEGVFDRIGKSIYGESIEALRGAILAAQDEVARQVAAAKANGGAILSKSEMKAIYDKQFVKSYTSVLKEIEIREAGKPFSGVGRFMASTQLLSRISKNIIELGFKTVGKGFQLVGTLGKSVLNIVRAQKSMDGTVVKKLVGAGELRSMGEKQAARALAKIAGKRAGILARAVSKMITASALVLGIPIVGQIISAVLFAICFLLLAVIPQVMSILADLDESQFSNNCEGDDPQGCPSSHPFNIICAMYGSGLGEAGTNILLAIPFVGDGIAAFGPYLCSSRDMSSTIMRMSFRPPPYYFDTTLSLYYTEKPKILDGGYNGREYADPAYIDPGNFRLRRAPEDYYMYDTVNGQQVLKTNSDGTPAIDGGKLPTKIKFDSRNENKLDSSASPFYHPWVDYAHSEILDKMAAFYYDNAKRNQTYDIDGIASFRYIRNFRGVIASSQYSCDVQVELTEVKYDPMRNVTISETKLDNPDEAEKAEIGCSFHDRRFYFTVDFTKCSGYNPTMTDITLGVNTWLKQQSSVVRIAEYRKMFVVVGCTNANGTAPGVMDLGFGDGEYIGEAPVGLGPLPNTDGSYPTYLPPKKNTGVNITTLTDLNGFVPTDDSCNMVSSTVTAFGVTQAQPSGTPPPFTPSGASMGEMISLASDADFGPAGVTDLTPTRKRTWESSGDDADIAYNAVSFGFTGNRWPKCATFGEIASKVQQPHQQGDIAYVTSEGRKYIYWNGSWQLYRPKPTWRSDAGGLNGAYLSGSTKLWRMYKVQRSDREKWAQGAWGGFMGSLPLFFGLEGGLVATTLDVTGANSKLACAYSDANKQQGTFAINGFTVTSETHFFLNKGPLIQYAPGYTPTYTNKCGTIPITQKVCANRYMIRSLNTRYMQVNNGTRRLKTITAILPNMKDRTCKYLVRDIAINPTDKTDIPDSGQNISISAKPRILDTTACSYAWDLGTQGFVIGGPNVVVDPLQTFDSQYFAPPITNTEFNALPLTEFAAMTAEQRSKLNATQQAQKQAATESLTRPGCDAATFGDCSKQKIKDALMADFNKQYQMVPGDPTKGYYAKIQTILEAKTPIRNAVGASDPVCVFKANVITKDATGRDNPPSTQIIKMVLDPSTEDNNCNYTIQSHDFPRKFFITPVPTNGFLELPALALAKNPNFARAESCKPAYSDCSNVQIINRLVNQFNQLGPDKKILQVVRAFTPIVPTDTQGVYCDFQADVLDRTGDKSITFLERQTLRFKLKAAPTDSPCLYDIDTELPIWDRGSGTSIDKQSGDQNLESPYSWPIRFIGTINQKINGVIASFRSQNMPKAMDDAAKHMNSELGKLQNTLASMQEIPGCVTGQNRYNCRNPEFVNAFIRRYNYDNWPKTQFGATKRSIIGVTKAGLAVFRECHIELMEMEETFVNFLKEPKRDRNNPTYESNKKYFTRVYKFVVNGTAGPESAPTLVGGNCQFTIPPFTDTDIANRSFDIFGAAYGIDTINPDVVTFKEPQLQLIRPTLQATIGINPWSLQVLNHVRMAVNTFNSPTYGKPNFVRMELEKIYTAVNVQPNVIEFGVSVNELYNDPDFGLVPYRGEMVILRLTWNGWDPISASFPTGVVPPPVTPIIAMNVSRAGVVDKTKVGSDGQIFDNPPYLFFTTMTESQKFALDYNPTTEQTRLTYASPGNPTSYVAPRSDGTWGLYVNASATPATYMDATPVRLYVAL